MAQKWVTALLVGLMAMTAACGGSTPANPSRTTPLFPVVPSTNSSKAKADINNKEVEVTGCDIPSIPVRQETNSYDRYTAQLEIRKSDLQSCGLFYWLRLTPINVPSGEDGAKFAAVLRVSDRNDNGVRDLDAQNALSPNPRAVLSTRGHVLAEGQHVRACLVLLDKGGKLLSQDFVCTTPYTVP